MKGQTKSERERIKARARRNPRSHLRHVCWSLYGFMESGVYGQPSTRSTWIDCAKHGMIIKNGEVINDNPFCIALRGWCERRAEYAAEKEIRDRLVAEAEGARLPGLLDDDSPPLPEVK